MPLFATFDYLPTRGNYMRILGPLFAFLVALTGLQAEENAITAFRIRIGDGSGSFCLTGHTLTFTQGDRAEESMALTDNEVRHSLQLLTSNPMLDKKYAAKPAEKEVAVEIHFNRLGGADEARYLTDADAAKIEEDLEVQAKANENNPKALEKLDEQSDFFAYVFGLAMKSKERK